MLDSAAGDTSESETGVWELFSLACRGTKLDPEANAGDGHGLDVLNEDWSQLVLPPPALARTSCGSSGRPGSSLGA